ncbi:MAG: prephenate dehydrogenase/arogenate dehydrogenase family protein [Desulfovibrio sp.]|jgi:prephenate dehydrogenase|nr:prephenate dehydrogenase/arogenate dehydrogenase family protein [Desulfovibrio sp.]
MSNTDTKGLRDKETGIEERPDCGASVSLPELCIVGAHGKMGRMFSERLGRASCRVYGVDRKEGADGVLALDGAELDQALAQTQFVMLCVPVKVLREVLAFVAPRLDPARHVLMDICSVKSLPMRWMEEFYPSRVVGAHPLFGPTPEAVDMRVALVRGSRADTEACAKAEALFKSLGCATFWTSATEHDAGVGIAQSLNFAVSAAFFCALARREGIKPFLTPSFKRHLEAARKHLTVDTAMFCEFTALNPEFPKALADYQKVLGEIAAGQMKEVAAAARVWYEENSPVKN